MNGQPTLLPLVPGEAEAVADLDRFFEIWPMDDDEQFSLTRLWMHTEMNSGVVLMALGRLVVSGKVSCICGENGGIFFSRAADPAPEGKSYVEHIQA